jgi:hypothetical protein
VRTRSGFTVQTPDLRIYGSNAALAKEQSSAALIPRQQGFFVVYDVISMELLLLILDIVFEQVCVL